MNTPGRSPATGGGGTPFYRSTEYCRGCGLTLMLERNGAGELLGVQVSRTRQGSMETTGQCTTGSPGWEWGYFLPEPHGAGMRRVDSREWYGEIRKKRERLKDNKRDSNGRAR